MFDSSKRFLSDVFEGYAYQSPPEEFSLFETLLDDELMICKAIDRTLLQESWSYRSHRIARDLSFHLIDEKGNLEKAAVKEAIRLLQGTLFSLGLERHHDDSRQIHLLNMLRLLEGSKDVQNTLKKIQKPEGNALADQVIRVTLNLDPNAQVTTSHARRAALSALFTKLRQNVGSCFATAPAIVVHDFQPLKFLEDIVSLFGLGRLSRTYGGIQYAVPLSPNWGVGDLFRPIFLNGLGENPLRTLSFSPGLQRAFASAALIKGDFASEKNRQATETLLKKALVEIEKGSVLFITPEEVIKKTLLSFYGLTEADVQAYQNRSIEGPLGELLLNPPLAKKSKSLTCNRFLKAFDQAKSAFKSITDNALLKAWEFTLASFAESKSTFAKWNLYLSLGVSSEDAYGIGQTIYEEVQRKITEINARLEEWQSQYDHLFAQAKYLEGRFRRAQESEIGWIRAEYEIRKGEINKLLDERDETYEKGRKLTNLPSFLVTFYGEKIPEYFQEIYDAEMHDVSVNLYDDSPAGFRLLYKHGRSNPSLWTLVHSEQEYIQNLTSFFVATEIELSQRPEIQGIEREVSSLVTSIITTTKRPEFLEHSINRLARAYQEPYIKNALTQLDQIKRKPWAYVSGGTMTTLVSSYFGNEADPSMVKRWIESEIELLAFMIDTVKELPDQTKEKFFGNKELPLLAFSPTHAFLLKPGFELFRNGWESDAYTYTWIRDEWIYPSLRFLDENVLDVGMMRVLAQEILQIIPSSYRTVAEKNLDDFLHPLSAVEFREKIINNLSYDHFLKQNEFLSLLKEEIDSLLFRTLPLFPAYQLQERLERIFSEIEIEPKFREKLFTNYPVISDTVGSRSFLSSYDLKNYAKGLVILALKQTRSSFPFHQKITKVMQKLNYAYPQPLLVADTNWVKSLFGFVVSPGTGKVEFWRFDESGSEGRPISTWKKYLDGTDKKEWGIYNNPRQYDIN